MILGIQLLLWTWEAIHLHSIPLSNNIHYVVILHQSFSIPTIFNIVLHFQHTANWEFQEDYNEHDEDAKLNT